ncbi:MAG TPA: SGNH/GDSL hydrolase family protein [Verrucomicrobiota bacterium]|nr:SGNH/GDSL hydrolase family protein [Verrucomicrobiota bacterium]HRZ37575.1 SGNH/GDSL hydrolase family protein [Candidatus Paceibacterota bacterium]
MKTQAILLTTLSRAGAIGLLRAQPVPSDPPYSALYVFGDSWSWTAGGPYWRSHWSNGPMWPELLSTNWGLTFVPAHNYAGAATTADVIGSQVPRFRGSSNAPTALFVVWAGGNDLWYHLFPNNTLNPAVLTNANGWSNLFVRMTRNLSNSVVRLHQNGARTVLVSDLDPVQRAPGFASRLSSAQRDQVGQQVQVFNRVLADALAALDAAIPNLRVLRFNLHDRWNVFLDEAVNLGFVRTDLGALLDPALKDKSFTGLGKDYVFWDENHTTSRTHGVWTGWLGEVATQTRTESLRLRTEGDAFTLELSKLKPGRAYALEVGSNLVEWAVHESFAANEGTNTVRLAAAPSPSDSGLRAFRLSWRE